MSTETKTWWHIEWDTKAGTFQRQPLKDGLEEAILFRDYLKAVKPELEFRIMRHVETITEEANA